MKTKIFFLCVILITFAMVSCKEEKEDLTLTGDWQGTITVDSDVFDFELVVNQMGSQLEGEFIFINPDGYTFPYSLNSSSMISGNKVFINFDEDVYQFRLKGTVNSSFDAMQGTHTVNGISRPTLVWSAYKK
jgi:hypothetical protein